MGNPDRFPPKLVYQHLSCLALAFFLFHNLFSLSLPSFPSSPPDPKHLGICSARQANLTSNPFFHNMPYRANLHVLLHWRV